MCFAEFEVRASSPRLQNKKLGRSLKTHKVNCLHCFTQMTAVCCRWKEVPARKNTSVGFTTHDLEGAAYLSTEAATETPTTSSARPRATRNASWRTSKCLQVSEVHLTNSVMHMTDFAVWATVWPSVCDFWCALLFHNLSPSQKVNRELLWHKRRCGKKEGRKRHFRCLSICRCRTHSGVSDGFHIKIWQRWDFLRREVLLYSSGIWMLLFVFCCWLANSSCLVRVSHSLVIHPFWNDVVCFQLWRKIWRKWRSCWRERAKCHWKSCRRSQKTTRKRKVWLTTIDSFTTFTKDALQIWSLLSQILLVTSVDFHPKSPANCYKKQVPGPRGDLNWFRLFSPIAHSGPSFRSRIQLAQPPNTPPSMTHHSQNSVPSTMPTILPHKEPESEQFWPFCP